MTEEQLQAMRIEIRIGRKHPERCREEGGLFDQTEALLAYVDFLQKLIHDLKQESTAYQRGLELGMAAERERCYNICVTVANWNPDSDAAECGEQIKPEAEHPWNHGQPTCRYCNGLGYITETMVAPDVTAIRTPCPVCSGREANPS